MSKIKILCTGSCGFIFSNFVRRVLFHNNDEYVIVSVDKVLLDKGINNIYGNKSHTMHIGDIADRHFMDTIFQLEKPDIVINGAAESFVDSSITDATPFVHSNILGTQVIIDMCLKHNVNKLIQISTDEVLGQLNEDDESWTEESPLNPRNPYSASKASAELMVQAANKTHGLKYNITRSCNNYGPRQPNRNLIPKIVYNIVNGLTVPIFDKGQQLREWIHVTDHCDAILHIIKNGNDNEIYNISSGHEFSNIEVFHEICNIIGRGNELLKFVSDRPGHDFRYSLNSTKLRELGWAPKIKFKDGLKTCVSWYQKNLWYLR